MALLRLFDPTTQFQTKSGALNVAGKLRVFIENTDDLANIYGDDGSLLSQPLLLDSNGRARGLFVDSGLSYRLEAYDRNDSLLFTIRRLEPNASGTIINPRLFIKGTPGEIDVEDSVTGKNRTYTVSLSAKVKGKIDENREAIVKESEARKAALDGKVDKVEGKGLSTEDYTTADKTKLDGIAAGTASPLMDGKASVGNSLKYAREDHVHPSDTSREDIANKTTVVLGTSDSKYPTDRAVAEFVNSSIATNTANYISNNGEPFTSVEQLEAYSGPVTNNDYAFVTGTDSEGNTYYDRYKATVSGSTVTWALEYRLNNSSFTAAQWSAINSGITSVLVAKIHEHGNKNVLDGITSDKVNSWDGKEDAFDVLPTTKGGTGTNAASKSALTSSLINSLSAETSTPKDGDYYVSQYAGGGTTTTSYHRRPVSALWDYIKGKISSVLGLTASAYSGKAATAGTADKAVADKSGNDIETTYATKTELSTHKGDTTVHITADERTAWNAKQAALTAGDNISITDNVISAEKQVIYAEYGKTSYDTVKNAIINGFDVIVRYSGNIYHSMHFAENNTGSIYFKSIGADEIREISLNTSGWKSYSTSFQKKLTFDKTPTAGSNNPVTSDGIKTALDAKQDTLTAGDNVTIANNVISSNQVFVATYGVTEFAKIRAAYDAGKICTVFKDMRYYYIKWIDSASIMFETSDGKNTVYSLTVFSSDRWSTYTGQLQSKLTFDTTPTAGSNNPVTSGGVKTAIDSVDAKGIVINEIDGENVICFE